MAPFEDSWALVQAIVNALKGVQVELSSLDMKAVTGQDFNAVKNALCQLMGSKTLRAAMEQCSKRCLYEGLKITKDTFEPENARGDYLPCALEVIKFNCAPFFKNLDLSFLKSGPSPEAAPG